MRHLEYSTAARSHLDLRPFDGVLCPETDFCSDYVYDGVCVQLEKASAQALPRENAYAVCRACWGSQDLVEEVYVTGIWT